MAGQGTAWYSRAREGRGRSAALAGEQQSQAVEGPRGLGRGLRQRAGGEVGEGAGAAGAAALAAAACCSAVWRCGGT